MTAMNLSLPKVTLNILSALNDVGVHPHRTLIIGQKVSGGTAAADALLENIGNENEWDDYFGKDSHLAGMVRHFRRINPVSPLDVYVLADNNSGTAATGKIAITGTATETRDLEVIIGSEKDHKLVITVASGDDNDDVVTAIAAAINADDKIQLSASADLTDHEVDLTANHKGTIGNQILIRLKQLPAGLTFTVTAMANGAGNPTLTNLWTAIDGRRYQTIVYPGTYDLTSIDDFLEDRWNVDNDILDGVAIMTKTDTYSNLLTWQASTNNQLIVAIGNAKQTAAYFKGGALKEYDDNISAQFAGFRALRFTDGKTIAKYVLGQGPRDTFGGAHMGAYPYFNTPFYQLPLIEQGTGFTAVQTDNLNAAGVSLFGNNVANNTVICGQVVTTYLTDAAGNEDKSFKFLEYVDTISLIREYMFLNLRRKYAQCRLTDGPLRPGYSMANTTSIKAFVTGLYDNLSDVGYVLTRGGEDNIKFFRDNLSCTLDLENGRAIIDMTVPIVVQLREILGTIRIAFNADERF